SGKTGPDMEHRIFAGGARSRIGLASGLRIGSHELKGNLYNETVSFEKEFEREAVRTAGTGGRPRRDIAEDLRGTVDADTVDCRNRDAVIDDPELVGVNQDLALN
ncbi:hypothetical protein, partial [Brucella intermedia]|uniref:hypothetical protein n=1 Tax=Brucella intermedia TaxID=94625 RepID=UPI00235F8DC8